MDRGWAWVDGPRVQLLEVEGLGAASDLFARPGQQLRRSTSAQLPQLLLSDRKVGRLVAPVVPVVGDVHNVRHQRRPPTPPTLMVSAMTASIVAPGMKPREQRRSLAVDAGGHALLPVCVDGHGPMGILIMWSYQ